jgi:hypothetical protein
VVIAKDKPFLGVAGYTADLFYDLDNLRRFKQREGAQISFNNEDYNIVAIHHDELVLSAKSNQKKWTIKAAPSAAPTD